VESLSASVRTTRSSRADGPVDLAKQQWRSSRGRGIRSPGRRQSRILVQIIDVLGDDADHLAGFGGRAIALCSTLGFAPFIARSTVKRRRQDSWRIASLARKSWN
jgi:hypothetical protein